MASTIYLLRHANDGSLHIAIQHDHSSAKIVTNQSKSFVPREFLHIANGELSVYNIGDSSNGIDLFDSTPHTGMHLRPCALHKDQGNSLRTRPEIFLL